MNRKLKIVVSLGLFIFLFCLISTAKEISRPELSKSGIIDMFEVLPEYLQIKG